MSYGDAAAGLHQWTLDEDAAAAVLPAGRRAGRHVLGHRERLPGRHLGGVRRAGDHPVLPARGHRARHQGQREDARRPRRQRPVPQGHPRAGRRLAAPAGHRLHRRLLRPPLRPRDAGRGDHGDPRRPGAGGQGALPRRVVDVGVAVREDAARRGAERLDDVRGDAGPVQRAQARGGAGHDPDVPRPGRRPDPVLAAGQGPRGPAVGRADRALVVGRRRQGVRPRRRQAGGGRRSRRSPRRAVSRWPRSRWPGCCPSRSSPARSWAPPSRTTCRTPSPPWTSTLTDGEIAALEEPYTPQDNYWW